MSGPVLKIYKTNPKFLVLPIFGGKSGVVEPCPDMGLYLAHLHIKMTKLTKTFNIQDPGLGTRDSGDFTSWVKP